MFDFLSKAGSSVMDSLSNAGSAVADGVQSGLSHTFDKLQDPEFMQQAGLMSAALSNDQTRYQSALTAYDKRRAEIAKQKREDVQRAEERSWKLDDLKQNREWSTEDRDMGYAHDMTKMEKGQEYTVQNAATQQGYTVQNNATNHGYNLASQNNQHVNGLKSEVFKNSSQESQVQYLTGADGNQYEVRPVQTQPVAPVQSNTQTYNIPAGMSQTGQDTKVTVEGPATELVDEAGIVEQQGQTQPAQVQATPEQTVQAPVTGFQAFDPRVLKPKQQANGLYGDLKPGTQQVEGKWVNVSVDKEGNRTVSPASAAQVNLANPPEDNSLLGKIKNPQMRTLIQGQKSSLMDTKKKVVQIDQAYSAITEFQTAEQNLKAEIAELKKQGKWSRSVEAELKNKYMPPEAMRTWALMMSEVYAKALQGGSASMNLPFLHEVTNAKNPAVAAQEKILGMLNNGSSVKELTRLSGEISYARDVEHKAAEVRIKDQYRDLRDAGADHNDARNGTIFIYAGTGVDTGSVLNTFEEEYEGTSGTRGFSKEKGSDKPGPYAAQEGKVVKKGGKVVGRVINGHIKPM